ncbi:MAG TPA: helix-turn-helix domain-containing protein [Terriglobales bacterium]|nr:helix-turn-helix domain-containing protein [Terriglobales bacterium]
MSWYTPKVFAVLMQISVERIYLLCRQGRLPVIRLHGRWRIKDPGPAALAYIFDPEQAPNYYRVIPLSVVAAYFGLAKSSIREYAQRIWSKDNVPKRWSVADMYRLAQSRRQRKSVRRSSEEDHDNHLIWVKDRIERWETSDAAKGLGQTLELELEKVLVAAHRLREPQRSQKLIQLLIYASEMRRVLNLLLTSKPLPPAAIRRFQSEVTCQVAPSPSSHVSSSVRDSDGPHQTKESEDSARAETWSGEAR